MIKYFKLLHKREMYSPGLIGLIINPFYFSRHGLSRAVQEMAGKMSGDLLDVGCGTKPYQKYFKVKSYIGLDIESPATLKNLIADDFYDGKKFPYDDDVFDSVLCNQVLEHVFNPEDFLGEINRVLKRRGKLLLTIPFVWDEHEQPYDYARYSTFGLKFLMEKSGFKVLEHHRIGADITVLFQLLNAYLFKISQSWPKVIRQIFTVVAMGSINVIGALVIKIAPANTDLFLDQIILVEKSS